MDIDTLFAGTPMALDRSALPRLAQAAQLRAGGANLEQLAQHRDLDHQDVTVQRSGATAIVSLTGVITSNPVLAFLTGGITPDGLVASLRSAATDPEVKDILLLVDSPGGEVALMVETASTIRRLREVKPITAFARPLMASAAFWLASQATEVVATPSADVGSVGVFAIHLDASKLNEKAGVRPTYITSSALKIEGHPDGPLGDEAAAHMQKRVDQSAATFVSDLAKGRGIPEATVRSQFGDGRMFSADEALVRGMVDRVATFEATVARLQSGVRPMRAVMARATPQALTGEDLRRADEEIIMATLTD